MAHTVSLSDGVTTISLTSSGVIVTDFPLRSPESRQSNALLGTDGSEITRPQWENPTESIEVLITGTPSAVREKGRAIEQMLNQARDSRRVMSAVRVYLQVQIDGEADTYRSEILSARFIWQNPLGEVPRGKASANIILTRRFYWEGPELPILLTSAATGTPTTNRVMLFNDHDQSSNNFFNISSAESNKAGQLPSPLRIRLRNEHESAVAIRDLYMTNTTFVGTLSLFRRGDQNSLGHGATYTTASSNNLVAYVWTLTDAMLAAMNGRYMRILAGFNSPGFDGYIQAAYRISTADAYRNEQIRGPGDFLLDCGAVPIPPARPVPNPTLGSLALYVQKQGGITVSLRYVQMTPAGDGLFRRLHGIGQVATLVHIVDDGIEGVAYQQSGAGTQATAGLIFPYHTPIHIWPGRTNRIRVLYRTATGLGAGNMLGAQAWVRPRRLTI